MDFESLVAQHANSGRVFPIEIDGARYWVKFARKNYPNLVSKLLGGLFRTVGDAGVQHEIDALQALRVRGLKTPDVVYSNKYYMVLSDIGPTLQTLFEQVPVDRERLSFAAGQALRRLHHAGGWHGGARIYNMTWDNNEIGFIDLENTVDFWMPLGGRRLWDLWQLAHSIGSFDGSGVLTASALRGYGPGWANFDLRVFTMAFIGAYLLLAPFQSKLKRELAQTVAVFRGVFLAQADLRRR